MIVVIRYIAQRKIRFLEAVLFPKHMPTCLLFGKNSSMEKNKMFHFGMLNSAFSEAKIF